MVDSGLVTSIVAIVGFALSWFGVAVDPSLINGAVVGIIAVVTLVAAVWSAYSHAQKNAAA